MNEEIQQIKTLFSSTNKDDVVLGIILMKKLNLFDELFKNTDWDLYDKRCDIPALNDDDRLSLIYEGDMFYRSFNEFIGRIREDKQKSTTTIRYMYYNDNSIPGI